MKLNFFLAGVGRSDAPGSFLWFVIKLFVILQFQVCELSEFIVNLRTKEQLIHNFEQIVPAFHSLI